MRRQNISITVGQPFSRLTVLNFAGRNARGRKLWNCLCLCGTEKPITQDALSRGTTESCGCLRKERTSAANRTHGQSGSPLHRIWNGMWQRCTNPKRKAYPHYGGRGITVTPEWKSFEKFATDVGERPGPDYQLERRENDKGYTKDNVYWATCKQQARNRRSSRIIEFNREKKTLAEWAEQAGLKPITIHARLKNGWGLAQALTTPATKTGLQKRLDI